MGFALYHNTKTLNNFSKQQQKIRSYVSHTENTTCKMYYLKRLFNKRQTSEGQISVVKKSFY